MVYAQIFKNKSYIWVPAKILERKGTVNYIVSISFKNSPASTKNLFTNNQNSALSHQSVASTSDSIPQVAQDEISDSIQQVVEAEISLHSNEATSTSQNSNEAISTSQNVIRRSTRNRRAPERYQCT